MPRTSTRSSRPCLWRRGPRRTPGSGGGNMTWFRRGEFHASFREGGSARHPAVAVDELLLGAPRREMELLVSADLLELVAELVVDAFGVVARDRQAAALLGSVRPERRDHHVPVRLERAPHGGDVPRTRRIVGQEMKDRTIVPEVELML